MGKSFYQILGIDISKRKEIKEFATTTGVSVKRLDYYNLNHIVPSISESLLIENHTGISRTVLMLKMGIFNEELLQSISDNADVIISGQKTPKKTIGKLELALETSHGTLYKGDCMDLLDQLADNSVDLVFADPPFNLNKDYLSNIDDNLSNQVYLNWCYKWIDGCIRILKEGGSLLIWNIPKWNTYISNYLNQRMYFRNWIANDIKFSLPIQGRFYPSHYSLLYYTKGDKPNTFKPDRLAMETCSKCYTELKDYGGYKDKMNPDGINLTDVWYDIPSVKHKKYKNRKEANELSVKLLDRIIEFSTKEGDVIFDPFGGAGTTYVVSEIKNRRWIGIELGPVEDIVKRLANLDKDKDLIEKYRKDYNSLFPEKIKKKRIEKGMWTDDSFKVETKN